MSAQVFPDGMVRNPDSAEVPEPSANLPLCILCVLRPTSQGRFHSDKDIVHGTWVVAKGSVGNGKPVRHSLHRTPTQAQQARWAAVQQPGGRDSPCGP